MVGWLVELRMYIALAVFQPYRDLEARDIHSLKFKWRDRESNSGPLAPQVKSFTTRSPPLPVTFMTCIDYNTLFTPLITTACVVQWKNVCLLICGSTVRKTAQIFFFHLWWSFLNISKFLSIFSRSFLCVFFLFNEVLWLALFLWVPIFMDFTKQTHSRGSTFVDIVFSFIIHAENHDFVGTGIRGSNPAQNPRKLTPNENEAIHSKCMLIRV